MGRKVLRAGSHAIGACKLGQDGNVAAISRISLCVVGLPNLSLFSQKCFGLNYQR